jgi:hypothetical protein
MCNKKRSIGKDPKVEINYVPPIFLCGMSGTHMWYEQYTGIIENAK